MPQADAVETVIGGDFALRVCSANRTIKPGDSIVLIDADVTAASRWTVVAQPDVPCQITVRFLVGEDCDAPTYNIGLQRTFVDTKVADLAWIGTGLARRLRVYAFHNDPTRLVNIRVRVMFDRVHAAIGVTTLGGTQLLNSVGTQESAP